MVYSSTLGIFTSYSVFWLSDINSNKLIWPVIELFFSLATLSMMSIYTNINCLRLLWILSNAPALMKFSIVLLLTSFEERRSIKFFKLVYLPFSSLSLTMASITFLPILFIALNPYTIFPLSTVNPISPLFISGGNMFIPITLQVLMYSVTLVLFSITDVIRAAMYSTG